MGKGLFLGVIVMITLGLTGTAILFHGQSVQQAYAVNSRDLNWKSDAPSVISGNNVYIAWWNGTEGEPDKNVEIFFRSSDDGGATFGEKVNLSNSTDADSIRAQLSAEDGNVVVTWWELNQTDTVPVARISTDNGETFGPMLFLAQNGTIGNT